MHIDVTTPALRAGWRAADALEPDELVAGVAMLQVSNQSIPVRLIEKADVDATTQLDAVYMDVLDTLFVEQYVIMEKFSAEEMSAFARRFAEVRTRLVEVGTYADYLAWLPARMGPIGRLPMTSPLRQLVETLLCTSSAPEPRSKSPMRGDYSKSAIEPSFVLGQKGVQAIETLFRYIRGVSGVENLELLRKWQKKDVDLRIREAGLGSSYILVEVKNEDKDTGNMVLELKSNIELDTPGWFVYSEAQVLVSIMWKTGDVVLVEMEKAREWVRSRKTPLRPARGKVQQQNYHSLVLLAPLNALLQEIPESIHLRLSDWLGQLYAGEFDDNSLIEPGVQQKKALKPRKLPA
ncbi:hypothetical protein KTD31_02400 [Burkholderia multivorans]|uniref:hypothetical protein n=1 Tax=Burkholderia multivorans TaxID=87883 RepID=UPI001C22ABEE|nr:hypothetical protein [Burkholderia multivorans]MBU9200256.1 hypothetical protein [Burkholderia multivorans]MDN8078617.1 hypothetical protein [Burkholderia multivorans]